MLSINEKLLKKLKKKLIEFSKKEPPFISFWILPFSEAHSSGFFARKAPTTATFFATSGASLFYPIGSQLAYSTWSTSNSFPSTCPGTTMEENAATFALDRFSCKPGSFTAISFSTRHRMTVVSSRKQKPCGSSCWSCWLSATASGLPLLLCSALSVAVA